MKQYSDIKWYIADKLRHRATSLLDVDLITIEMIYRNRMFFVYNIKLQLIDDLKNENY